jgi:hypothetical protein
VGLHRVPGSGLLGLLGPRSAIGAGEADGVRTHVIAVPDAT